MSETANPAPPTTRTRHRYLLAGLALAVAGAGAVWLLRHRDAGPAIPAVDLRDAPPDVAEAVAKARREVERTPESAAAWGRLGLVLRAHDFRGEANPCFAQAEKLDPADPRWPYHQALEQLISDPDAGLDSLRRAVAAGGRVPSPRLLLGEVLLSRGQTEEAAECFRRVLDAERDNPRAHLGLGRVAYERGDLPGSREHLLAALRVAPWVQAAHALLAELHFRLGDTAAADAERQFADRLPAGTPWPDPYIEEVARLRLGAEPRVALASQLIQQGRPDQAIGLLRETVHQYPDSYDAVLALGKTYLRVQPPDYPAAEETFRDAVRRQPDDPAAYFHLGIALEQQKKFPAAVEAYQHAVALKPDYAFAYFNLGQCRKQQGDRAAALDAFRNAVRCKPDLAEGHAALGELLAQSGRDADALAELRQALQLRPTDEMTKRLLDEIRKRNPAPK